MSRPTGSIWHRFLDWLLCRSDAPVEPDLSGGTGVWTEWDARRVLSDVQLLLEYLNRLPETRLDRYMGEAARLQAASGLPVPQAPSQNPAAFLSRIVAIAKASETPDWSMTDSNGVPGPAGEAPNDLAFLLGARDFLSAIAYPATVDSIRVTRAYREARAFMKRRSILAGTAQSHTDRFLAQFGIAMAKRVRRYQRGVLVLLFVAFWASFLVFWGNNLIAENLKLQDSLRQQGEAIAKAATEDAPSTRTLLLTSGQSNAALLVRSYCDYQFELQQLRSISVVMPQEVFQASPLALNMAQEAAQAGAQLPVFLVQEARGETSPRVWFSQRQHDLCAGVERLRTREKELKMLHLPWMSAAAPALAVAQALTMVLRGVNGLMTLAGLPELFSVPPQPRPPAGQGSDGGRREFFVKLDLDSHRIALEQLVPGLVGNILPMAYAALGSLASMFRRISARADAELLGPADYGAMRNSMILGLLTGAVIGLFSGALNGGAAETGRLPLGPTAFALLAGFAADRVFAMLDSLADRVFGALNNRGPAAPQ